MEPAIETAVEAPVSAPIEVDPPSIEDQIKDLEAKLEDLESQRVKSVVEELALEPEAFASVAKVRRKERFPRMLKACEKELKMAAWSGEKSAILQPNSNVFNDDVVKHLNSLGFKARVISMGTSGEFRIEVKWA